MPDVPLLLVAIVVIALAFDYTNGAHDCGNAIATVVSTRALSPKSAVIMAAALNLVGAFIGTKVAETIGKGIVQPDMVAGCQMLVLSALFGAIGWNLLTWFFGIPSSSSHALIGGLMGSAVAYRGWSTLHGDIILEKVILPLFLSPLVGFAAGLLLMTALARLFSKAHPRRANDRFRRLQIGASAFMAISHGLNDAQKTMGLITLALFLFHQIPEMTVPAWVKIACALAMALGTMTGGWRIIKTMGHSIFHIQPVHGFAVASTSAAVILAASGFGAPISTTQTISSSILGVGAAKRFSAVRWGVASRMVISWFFTIPASGLLAAFFFEIVRLLGWV